MDRAGKGVSNLGVGGTELRRPADNATAGYLAHITQHMHSQPTASNNISPISPQRSTSSRRPTSLSPRQSSERSQPTTPKSSTGATTAVTESSSPAWAPRHSLFTESVSGRFVPIEDPASNANAPHTSPTQPRSMPYTEGPQPFSPNNSSSGFFNVERSSESDPEPSISPESSEPSTRRSTVKARIFGALCLALFIP